MIKKLQSTNQESAENIVAAANRAIQRALWEHKLLGNEIATGDESGEHVHSPNEIHPDERFHPGKKVG